MKLNLVTLNGVKYDEEVYGVQLPTMDGIIGVYPEHEPLLSVLVPGVIIVQRSREHQAHEWEHYATSGGVLEVTAQDIKVVVDEADHSDDINEAEAEKARQAAEKLLATATDQVEIEHAQALVDRHAVRLQVANLRRRNRSR